MSASVGKVRSLCCLSHLCTHWVVKHKCLVIIKIKPLVSYCIGFGRFTTTEKCEGLVGNSN